MYKDSALGDAERRGYVRGRSKDVYVLYAGEYALTKSKDEAQSNPHVPQSQDYCLLLQCPTALSMEIPEENAR